MHLSSLSSRHVHLDMKLFMRAQNGSCAMNISYSGLYSTGLRSLRPAGRHYNIPLCLTNLSSNRFFIRCTRLWNSLPIDIISKGRLPIIYNIMKHY